MVRIHTYSHNQAHTHLNKNSLQEERCSRPLYSSHTPHPPPTQPAQLAMRHSRPQGNTPSTTSREKGVLPQTPNSAPMLTTFNRSDRDPHTHVHHGQLFTMVNRRILNAPTSACPPGFHQHGSAAPHTDTQQPTKSVPQLRNKSHAP